MVSIDKEKCIGCGSCVAIAPKCFKIGKDFKAELIKGCKCVKECKEAAEACPVGAIKL